LQEPCIYVAQEAWVVRRNTRIDIEGLGWIDYDLMGEQVRVGDRLLPSELDVHFPGAQDQPALRMHLAVVNGVPQCRSLTIESKAGAREVRTLDVRAVALEDWIEKLYSLTGTVILEEGPNGEVTAGVVTWNEKDLRQTVRTIQQARAVSRRKITPAFLADVAKVYRAHADERPVEAVQAAFGGSYRTAAMYVQRARAAKLLPPTTQGKVSS
jgi:hypothetical protein